MQFADPDILQRVSEAPKKLRGSWAEGVSLEFRTGRTLVELRDRSVADRLAFARDVRRRARQLQSGASPMYRDAISRYYYSLYHAFRAVVSFAHDGDDYEEHSKLSTGIPDDFPDVETWRNNLKTARLTRNKADYNPYPKSNNSWRFDCEQLEQMSNKAIGDCRSYLASKGCLYV